MGQPNTFHAQGKDVAVNITVSGTTSARSAEKDEDGWTTAVRPRSPLAFPIVNRFSVAVLYRRAGRLTAKNGGFRPGQSAARRWP